MLGIFKKKKTQVQFEPDRAIELLSEAADICEQYGITTWLTDGTLLGYYRQGGFIEHDKDMDLGAFVSHYDQGLEAEFLKRGWQVKRKLGSVQQGLEITLRKDFHHLDIFFFYEDNGTYWHAAWQGVKIKGKKFRRMIKYRYPRFSLTKALFLGHEFNIPQKTEQYLFTKYGAGWAVPQKDWDWALGPANAEVTDILLPKTKIRGKSK